MSEQEQYRTAAWRHLPGAIREYADGDFACGPVPIANLTAESLKANTGLLSAIAWLCIAESGIDWKSNFHEATERMACAILGELVRNPSRYLSGAPTSQALH